MHLYYYHENVLLIKTTKHSTKCCFLELEVMVLFTIEMLVEVDRTNDISAGSHNHHSCYSSICHERPPPVRSESGPSFQVAARYRDINTAQTVVGALQKWPAKAGGRSPKGPAVAGTTVLLTISFFHLGGVCMTYCSLSSLICH